MRRREYEFEAMVCCSKWGATKKILMEMNTQVGLFDLWYFKLVSYAWINLEQMLFEKIDSSELLTSLNNEMIFPDSVFLLSHSTSILKTFTLNNNISVIVCISFVQRTWEIRIFFINIFFFHCLYIFLPRGNIIVRYEYSLFCFTVPSFDYNLISSSSPFRTLLLNVQYAWIVDILIPVCWEIWEYENERI